MSVGEGTSQLHASAQCLGTVDLAANGSSADAAALHCNLLRLLQTDCILHLQLVLYPLAVCTNCLDSTRY